MRIANGRAVSYYEYGAPDGTPVFALHGTPASGAGFVFLDESAAAHRVRVVAPDRPGVGASDRVDGATAPLVVAYADDVVATANALGIDQFALLGYSGGAPYALGVAAVAPGRVTRVAAVSGAGQIGEWARLRDFEGTDRRMSRLSVHAPFVARAALRASALLSRVAPLVTARLALLEMSAPDREAMRAYESSRAALAVFTNAVSPSARGVVDDYAASARRWGFDVASIAVPVKAWHGTDDHIVPFRHSEELVARIPATELVAWPGEGHLALFAHVDEVLTWLVDSAAD